MQPQGYLLRAIFGRFLELDPVPRCADIPLSIALAVRVRFQLLLYENVGATLLPSSSQPLLSFGSLFLHRCPLNIQCQTGALIKSTSASDTHACGSHVLDSPSHPRWRRRYCTMFVPRRHWPPFLHSLIPSGRDAPHPHPLSSMAPGTQPRRLP